MKTRILVSCLVAIALGAWLGNDLAAAGEVSQGKCIQFDEANHQITIESYDIQFSKTFPYGQPTGDKEVFDVSKATIGIRPEPGDILRLAWVNQGNVKSALRVMNVSKQDLRKK